MKNEKTVLLVLWVGILGISGVNYANQHGNINTICEVGFNSIIDRPNNIIQQIDNEGKKQLAERLAKEERLRKLEEERLEKERIAKELAEQKAKNPYYGVDFNIRTTYYTNSVQCTGNTRGIGAAGKKMQNGWGSFPKNIPFGTIMELYDKEGKLIYTLMNMDTGSAIKWKGNNSMVVDVYVEGATNQDLMNMGVDYYTGKIIRWGY